MTSEPEDNGFQGLQQWLMSVAQVINGDYKWGL
jgi:hypothetical protein